MIDTTKYTQLLILKRHWPLAIATSLTVVALVVPVALGMPNVYRAAAKLSVEKQVSTTTTQAQIFNNLETRLLMIRNETLSRPYLADIIERLNLYPELRRQTSLDTVVNRVQRDIAINPTSSMSSNSGPTTLTFTVAYLGDDPQKVKEVADALASFYIQQNDAMRNKLAAQAVSDLETQVKEFKRQAEDATSKYNNYITTHAGKLPEMMTMKSADLTRVNMDLANKQARYNAVKTTQNGYLLSIANANNQPTVVTGSAPQSKEQQLNAAYADERDLVGKGAQPQNVQLIAVRTRIKELQALPPDPVPATKPVATSQLDVYKQALEDANTELATLTKEIEKLEARQNTLMTELASIPGRNTDLDDLARSVTSSRDQLDAVQKQYAQAYSTMMVERSQENGEFRVLEAASFPADPAGPNRLGLILGGIVGALVLGLGMAVVRDQFDNSFHTIDELRGFTQVPILASIPHITTNTQRARRAGILVASACVLLVSLAFVGYGAYHYAARHAGLTRLITK